MEALAMRYCDLYYSVSPTKVKVRKEFAKNRVSREVYISDEATHFLKQWQDWKSRRIKKIAPNDLVFVTGDGNGNGIPVKLSSVYSRILHEFNYVLKIVGMDERKEGMKRRKITFEGPAKFHKGEKDVLFLHREQGYGGEYTTMGMDQGKFQVDSNGLVEAKISAVEEYWPPNATSLADFEADIKKILSQPKPEPIDVDSALYDRDLTTEEIKELERNTTGDIIVK